MAGLIMYRNQSEEDKKLLRAVMANDIQEIKDALTEGADVNARFTKNPDDGGNTKRNGLSALHMAVAKGNIKMTKILLEAGADVDAPDHGHDRPIHMIANYPERPNRNVMAILLFAAGTDMGAINMIGQTALDIARDDNNEELVEQLERTAGREKTKEETALTYGLDLEKRNEALAKLHPPLPDDESTPLKKVSEVQEEVPQPRLMTQYIAGAGLSQEVTP